MPGTGQPPFRDKNPLAVLKRVANDAPRPICELNDAIPQWLLDIVAKLHAKLPDDRIQSAQAAIAALSAGSANSPKGTEPGSLPPVQTRDMPCATAHHANASRAPTSRRILLLAAMLVVAVPALILFWTT